MPNGESISRGQPFRGCYLRGARLSGRFSDVCRVGLVAYAKGAECSFGVCWCLGGGLPGVSQLTAGFHNKATRRASAMKVRGGKRGPAQLGGISVPLAAVAEWRIYRARATISMGAISGVPDSPGASQMLCRVGSLAYARGAECSFGVVLVLRRRLTWGFAAYGGLP